VAPEWSARHRNAFDHGWDVEREQTFARYEELGVILADAELAWRHDAEADDERVARRAVRPRSLLRPSRAGRAASVRFHRPTLVKGDRTVRRGLPCRRLGWTVPLRDLVDGTADGVRT
jgi:hypothetical protein